MLPRIHTRRRDRSPPSNGGTAGRAGTSNVLSGRSTAWRPGLPRSKHRIPVSAIRQLARPGRSVHTFHVVHGFSPSMPRLSMLPRIHGQPRDRSPPSNGGTAGDAGMSIVLSGRSTAWRPGLPQVEAPDSGVRRSVASPVRHAAVARPT